jgi:hypothetical protein
MTSENKRKPYITIVFANEEFLGQIFLLFIFFFLKTKKRKKDRNEMVSTKWNSNTLCINIKHKNISVLRAIFVVLTRFEENILVQYKDDKKFLFVTIL